VQSEKTQINKSPGWKSSSNSGASDFGHALNGPLRCSATQPQLFADVAPRGFPSAKGKNLSRINGNARAAELNSSRTRSAIKDLSISATAPSTVKTMRPAGVAVSILSDRETNSIPNARKVSKARSTNGDSVTAILVAVQGRYQMLFALLAGCGPMRAVEALGLEIGKHISPDFRTLYIQQKAKAGEIQPYLKTKNGAREVDLCEDLAEMLKAYIGDRSSGLLFHTSSAAQILQTNVLRDSLHPTLEKLDHAKGGFNIVRRSRITFLGMADCPDALRHFWSGHAHPHISERYAKLLGGREYRLEWAERFGLGFEIPGSVGQPGLLRVVLSAA
jgi:integrase